MKNLLSKIYMQSDTNNKRSELYVILFLFLMTYLFLIYSPLHFLNRGTAGSDSSYYKTIALMMQNGFVPYKDSFDHKGMLLHFLQFIGNSINYYLGIWYIEFVSLFITFLYSFRIIKLFKLNNIITACILLLSYSYLFTYFESGNLTEEYALPFITVSLYYFLDYFINNKLGKKRILICGICLGAVLSIRPNMIAVWIVGCIYYFILNIRKKEIIYEVLVFLVGISLVLIPITIYLIVNKALGAYIDAYLLYNFKYSKLTSDSLSSNLKAKYEAFLFFADTLLSKVSIFSILIIAFIKKNYRLLIYLLFFLINIILVSISGNAFPHYGMIILPTFLLPLSLIIKTVIDNKEEYLAYTIICALSVTLLFSNWNDCIARNIYAVIDIKNKAEYNPFWPGENNIYQLIKENTDKNDRIMVYGSKSIYYVISKKMHATRFQRGDALGIDKKLKDEYWKQMNAEQPKIIIVTVIDDDIMKFIETNGYEKIYPGSNEVGDLVYKKIY